MNNDELLVSTAKIVTLLFEYMNDLRDRIRLLELNQEIPALQQAIEIAEAKHRLNLIQEGRDAIQQKRN